MNKQKKLWEKLAKENSKYYIYSSNGRNITDEEFEISGRIDYRTYILEDDLIDKSGTILDIGCGIGRITDFMSLDFNRVIGIDISGEMIRQARIRLEDRPNIEFFETNGELIPIKNNSIDVAFSYLVHQHIKTNEMVENNFKEVNRVLKPGGLFKVRIRTDVVKSMDSWWAGVNYSIDNIKKLTNGFKLLNKEAVGNYGLWLWLKKI